VGGWAWLYRLLAGVARLARLLAATKEYGLLAAYLAGPCRFKTRLQVRQ
jgi:hypothetical protein